MDLEEMFIFEVDELLVRMRTMEEESWYKVGEVRRRVELCPSPVVRARPVQEVST
jgi:hypothetical protein